MTETVFQKKLLEKAYFIVKTTGLAMAVLDFQKKMLGPAGPQVFIFGRQNKSSSSQKLYLRTIEMQ